MARNGTYCNIKPTINLKDLKAHEWAHKYYKNIAKKNHQVVLQSDPLSQKRRKKALASMLAQVTQPIKPKRLKKKQIVSPSSTKNKLSSIHKVIEEPVMTEKDQLIERNIAEYFERKELTKFGSTIPGNYTEISTKSTSSIGNYKHQKFNVPTFNLNQIEEERKKQSKITKNAKQSQRSIHQRVSKYSDLSEL